MKLSSQSSELLEFSRNLLVIIFAVCAFTAQPVFETNSLSVKVIIGISLGLSIAGIYFSYQAALIPMNWRLSIEQENLRDDAEYDIPIGKVRTMVMLIRVQISCLFFAFVFWVSALYINIFLS